MQLSPNDLKSLICCLRYFILDSLSPSSILITSVIDLIVSKQFYLA